MRQSIETDMDRSLPQAAARRRVHAPLYAAFSSREGVQTRKGPFARLRFEGGIVRERPGGPVIAQHADREWHVDGGRFSRLDVEGRVELQFFDGGRSCRYGPFGLFSFVDGVAFRDGQVLAYVDLGRNRWVRQDDGRDWPVLLVESAG